MDDAVTDDVDFGKIYDRTGLILPKPFNQLLDCPTPGFNFHSASENGDASLSYFKIS